MNLKNIQLQQKSSYSTNFKPYSTKASIKTKQNKSLLKRIKKNQIQSSNVKDETTKYNFDNFIEQLKNNQNPESNDWKSGKSFNITKVVAQAERKRGYINFIELFKINQLKNMNKTQERIKSRKVNPKGQKQLRLENLRTHHIKTEPIYQRSSSYDQQQTSHYCQDKKFLTPPRSFKNTMQIFLDYHNISKNEIPLPFSKRIGVFRYRKSETLKLPIKELKICFQDNDHS